jgi:hypothetical protein
MFGKSPSLNQEVVDNLDEADKEKLETIVNSNKKKAFVRQATLPALMLVCYLILFFRFKAQGGYKPLELGSGSGEAG